MIGFAAKFKFRSYKFFPPAHPHVCVFVVSSHSNEGRGDETVICVLVLLSSRSQFLHNHARTTR